MEKFFLSHPNFECSSKFSPSLSFDLLQALVIVATLVAVGINSWGVKSIRQEFDPVLLLPAKSYMRRWIEQNDIRWV